MNTYLVHESNFERLEKKLATISKKCAQTHCSFHYQIIGEKFIECKGATSGETYIAKYFEVEVDGTAKYNGWRFVATIDHHAEGNVIRAYDTELTIPDKYKSCGPTCEHCNKIRSRKDTYLIYNEENQEFKQVGKSCLQEFTNGLSAENITFFCSIYEKMEDGYEYSGPSSNRYIAVESILPYAFECYKHWGYQKSINSIEGDVPVGYRSTSSRVVDYYYINRAFAKDRERLHQEMDEVGFDANSEFAVENTKAALEWIRNEKDDTSEYIRNLHVICSDDYTDYRSLGFVVSLTTAYMRHIDKLAAYEKKQKALEETRKASQHVGQEGQRLTVNCTSFECKSSWDGYYGMTYLYQFKDADENIYIWYASNPVSDEERIVSVVGTVKQHSEFNGIKQTVLTRCKVTHSPKEEPKKSSGSSEVENAIDNFLAYCNS